MSAAQVDHVLADIDDALAGYVDRDLSVSADAMRWAPEPMSATYRPQQSQQSPHGPSPAQLATVASLRERVGPLTLVMLDGPQTDYRVAVPNPGYPPSGYRFAVQKPLIAFVSIVDPAPYEIPRAPVMEIDDYVFAGHIMADGSLGYRYAGRS